MKIILKILIAVLVVVGIFVSLQSSGKSDYLKYEVDLTKQDFALYWKNDQGEILRNFKNLKEHTAKKRKKLVFATNGGMYMENRFPLGLYIENSVEKKKLNSVKEAFGNFYLQPNGVFYVKKDKTAGICVTDKFNKTNVTYATQSGPMLLIDGSIHPKFNEGSKNTNIRNGVGILPDGKVIFAMSTKKVNFYEFAQYFKSKGCKNALYLDGYVSRTYLPEKKQNFLGGNFGVMIGVTEKF